MNGAVTMARNVYLGFGGLAGKLEPFALLLARLLVARVFWLSGLGKVENVNFLGLRLPTFSMDNSTYFLFKNVFFPELPKWFTDIAAIMAAIGELTLPLLLVFGFVTRLGALGLFAMTAVIQIFVFQDAWWPTHAWWMAVLFILIARGPGAWSADRFLGLERPSKQT
jgi:putative oxidoreductase